MKYTFLLTFTFLTACESLSNFQEQPVESLSENQYKTTCHGISEGWDSCFRKAKRTCSNGYFLIEKKQLNDVVHREVTFKCN